MSSRGFIYVLMNPSFDGLVKVGKTTRSPQNRVTELSSATGLPTPFQLVYFAEFEDWHAAERFVHAELAGRGLRVADNREFFRMAIHDAVSAVVSLEHRFSETHPPVDNQIATAPASERTSIVADLVREGHQYLFGENGNFQDTARALDSLKKAAKLGSGDACFTLGVQFRDGPTERNLELSKTFLLRGVELGSVDCYAELGRTFTALGQVLNAQKAWGHYLERAGEADRNTRAMALAFCMADICADNLDRDLLHLLRPYGSEIVAAFSDMVSHAESIGAMDVAKYYDGQRAVTGYLLLAVLPPDSGRIRYVNSDGGGWITGACGREFVFNKAEHGTPAIGANVLFSAAFPYVHNHGRAECVVITGSE
jgi:hypothetical protein